MRKTPIVALVAAEVVSILGSRMTYLALPWFVLVTTGSPSKMALVLAAEIAPSAILGIPSGIAVERLGARTTMLTCDAARLPLLASLPILHSAGMLSFPLLLALVFVLGCFMAPYFAAQRVILPELVGEDETTIAQANSAIEGGSAFAALAGPALAGILIPILGAPNVLYVDAATYGIAFLLLAGFVPKTKRLGQAATHGVLAGIKFLVRDRLLGPLGATVIVINFLGAALSATLPFYAYDNFSGDSKIAGLFFTAMGAGAVIGSIGAIVVVKRFPPLRLAAMGIVALTIPLWLLPLDLPAWGVMAALFTAMLFTPLGRPAAEDDDGVDLGERFLRTCRLPRRRAAARALGSRARFRRRGDRDDDGGARVRRDRAPASRRGGAGSHRDRSLGGLGEIAAQPLLRETLLLGRREPRPEVREHAADGGDRRRAAEVDRAAGEDLRPLRCLVVAHLGGQPRPEEVGDLGEHRRARG